MKKDPDGFDLYAVNAVSLFHPVGGNLARADNAVSKNNPDIRNTHQGQINRHLRIIPFNV